MREKQSCAVIKDLLPLYVDELTSEETNEIVREHLNQCDSCMDVYRCMSEGIVTEGPQGEEVEKEIDYLKRIRNKSRKKIAAVAGAVIVVVVAAIFTKVFVYGTPTEQYTSSILVGEDIVQIQGVFLDAKKAYSHYKVVEREGEKQLIVYAAKKSFWNKDRSFEIEYSLAEAEEQGLVVENKKVTSSGDVISTMAADIFAKKHAYIGDASKNGVLAYAMGIGEDLGAFTNELQTKNKPFGWTLQFQTILESSNEAIFNEKMRGYAYVLLATVENVDEINWSYLVRSDEGVEQKKMNLTVLEADGILGEEVKSFGTSEERIEELLLKVGLSPIGSRESELKEYRYRLTLTGRMPNAECDTTFVVLTNREGLTFDEVAKSLYSSNSADWLTDTVIVSME